MIKVIKPGLYTSIQDLGRIGFQKFGMPVSGVMDPESYRYANWLANNPLDNPVLEATLTGPHLAFEEDTYIAITGGNIKEVPKALQLTYTKGATIRVLEGLEHDYFTDEALDTFFSNSYKIGNQSNRMGYRLRGKKIKLKEQTNIISSGLVLGTIQIPKNGQPIIMMSDRQTVGGYPRIGNIATFDLSSLAQQKPGDRVRFKKITQSEAINLLEMRQKKHASFLEN